MTHTINVTMSRARLRRRLENIPNLAKQSHPLFRKLGAVVFRRIRKAFITKSCGGTDEAGERWQALSHITVLKRLICGVKS